VLVFEKVVRHSIGWFDHPDHSTGDVTAKLEEDAEAVSKVTGWSLGRNIQVLSSLVSGLIISLSYSWQIGLIAMACIPFIMLAALLQARFSKHTVVEQDGLSPATILETGLRNIALLQAYNLQQDVGDKYSEAIKPHVKSKVNQGIIAGLVFGFTQFAIFATFAVLFYGGVQLLLDLKVTFTDFFTSLLAVMFSAFGVGQVNADFGAKHKGLAAAARIFKIVDEPLDDDDPLSKNGAQPATLKGNVTFQSCGFHYPTRPEHPIYYPGDDKDGFNLTIPSKQSIGFVGRYVHKLIDLLLFCSKTKSVNHVQSFNSQQLCTILTECISHAQP
jgi:ATP-binding cassette subfamily B (MDR/TAP) protein 1